MNGPVQHNADESNNSEAERLRAFGELYQKFSPVVYRYIRSKVFNDHDAEQLAAQAWANAWETFELSQVPRFKPRILTIANNLRIDWIRKHCPDLLPKDFDPAADLPPSSDSSSDDERLAALRKCFQSIDEPFRTVLQAKLAGQKDKEISAKYGIPMGTVAKRMHLVRAQLKQCVEGRLA